PRSRAALRRPGRPGGRCRDSQGSPPNHGADQVDGGTGGSGRLRRPAFRGPHGSPLDPRGLRGERRQCGPNRSPARLAAVSGPPALTSLPGALLEAAFERSILGLAIIGRHEEILLANAAFARLLGYEPVDLIGTRLAELRVDGPQSLLRTRSGEA